METKKSKRANLENKRTIFLQSGFIIVLSLILVAFEWSSDLNRHDLEAYANYGDDTPEDIINTFREKPKKVELPKPKIIIPEELILADDNEEIDDNLDFSTEDDQTLAADLIYIDEPEPEEDKVFRFIAIEDKPMFPGGERGLLTYLAKNTKFPKMAIEAGIDGKVYVEFVIDKKGRVTEVKLQRGVHPLLDEEALRVVQSMPDWTPGYQRSKPVKVSFSVPISFKLQ
jgi:periplasmic protein TonB